MAATSPRPAARRVPFPIYEDESKPVDLVTLPADHFLAQRPVTPPRPESVIDGANWAGRAMPDTSSLAAADYDVSVATGFLPPEEPVQTLRGVGNGWDEVEDALERAQVEAARISGGGVGKLSEAWRECVRKVSALVPLETPLHSPADA